MKTKPKTFDNTTSFITFLWTQVNMLWIWLIVNWMSVAQVWVYKKSKLN
jgi:hypothetical protein